MDNIQLSQDILLSEVVVSAVTRAAEIHHHSPNKDSIFPSSHMTLIQTKYHSKSLYWLLPCIYNNKKIHKSIFLTIGGRHNSENKTRSLASG